MAIKRSVLYLALVGLLAGLMAGCGSSLSPRPRGSSASPTAPPRQGPSGGTASTTSGKTLPPTLTGSIAGFAYLPANLSDAELRDFAGTKPVMVLDETELDKAASLKAASPAPFVLARFNFTVLSQDSPLRAEAEKHPDWLFSSSAATRQPATAPAASASREPAIKASPLTMDAGNEAWRTEFVNYVKQAVQDDRLDGVIVDGVDAARWPSSLASLAAEEQAKWAAAGEQALKAVAAAIPTKVVLAEVSAVRSKDAPAAPVAVADGALLHIGLEADLLKPEKAPTLSGVSEKVLDLGSRAAEGQGILLLEAGAPPEREEEVPSWTNLVLGIYFVLRGERTFLSPLPDASWVSVGGSAGILRLGRPSGRHYTAGDLTVREYAQGRVVFNPGPGSQTTLTEWTQGYASLTPMAVPSRLAPGQAALLLSAGAAVGMPAGPESEPPAG